MYTFSILLTLFAEWFGQPSISSRSSVLVAKSHSSECLDETISFKPKNSRTAASAALLVAAVCAVHRRIYNCLCRFEHCCTFAIIFTLTTDVTFNVIKCQVFFLSSSLFPFFFDLFHSRHFYFSTVCGKSSPSLMHLPFGPVWFFWQAILLKLYASTKSARDFDVFCWLFSCVFCLSVTLLTPCSFPILPTIFQLFNY